MFTLHSGRETFIPTTSLHCLDLNFHPSHTPTLGFGLEASSLTQHVAWTSDISPQSREFTLLYVLLLEAVVSRYHYGPTGLTVQNTTSLSVSLIVLGAINCSIALAPLASLACSLCCISVRVGYTGVAELNCIWMGRRTQKETCFDAYLLNATSPTACYLPTRRNPSRDLTPRNVAPSVPSWSLTPLATGPSDLVSPWPS